MQLLVLIRDALIALALAWVGVTLHEREIERAPCEAATCQGQSH